MLIRTVFTLFLSDFKLIKHWFQTSRLSKILVILGFAIVFTLVFLFIFSFTRVFFQTLATFKNFGFLTSNYIIHSSIILIIWLGIGSSVMSTISLFINPNKNLTYLVSLPIKPLYLVSWFFLKTCFLNFLFLFFFFAPVAFAFSLSFWETISFDFVIRVVLVLSIIVLLTNSIGAIIAYTLAEKLSSKKTLLTFIGTAVFFLSMLLIFRIVLPQNLKLLYDASPVNFTALYERLPLSNPLLPTNILINTVTEGVTSSSLLAAFLVIVFAVLIVYLESGNFLGILQKLGNRNNIVTIPKSHAKTFSQTKYPLEIKDLLSIVRASSETGYALFLLGMLFFFFLLLRSLYGIGRLKSEWSYQLILFSFVWFQFFVTSYLLRLVFPLVAREGTSGWYLFSLPIGLKKILNSKIIVSFIISLPLILLSAVIWFILPFAAKNLLPYLIGLTLITTVLISLYQTLLGAIKPNFREGENSEKVSTSMMGIVTLIVSAVFIVFISKLLNNFLKNQFYLLTGMEIGRLLIVLILPVFLYFTANNLLKKEEF